MNRFGFGQTGTPGDPQNMLELKLYGPPVPQQAFKLELGSNPATKHNCCRTNNLLFRSRKKKKTRILPRLIAKRTEMVGVAENVLVAAVVVPVEDSGTRELSPEQAKRRSDEIVPVLLKVVECSEAALVIVTRGIIRLEVGQVERSTTDGVVPENYHPRYA